MAGRRGGVKRPRSGEDKPLHETMLDTVLAVFSGYVREAAEKLGQQAAQEGGAMARFLVEFTAQYASRQEERRAEELMRMLVAQAGAPYQPQDLEREEEDDAVLGGEEEGWITGPDLGATGATVEQS